MRIPSAVVAVAALSCVLLAGAWAATEEAVRDTPAARSQLRPNVAFATSDWPTEWTRSTIDLSELILGIGASEPRDAIPPIDDPDYESPDDAADWLVDREPGLLLRLDDEVRFFPLSILNRHEIVNDVIGGVPLSITYCPLCNSAVAFDRRVDDEVLRFGVSGLLRNNDLVMWDDRSVSLWQQATGEAIVGNDAGTRLETVPTAIVSFGDFRNAFPEGLSLSRDTGFELAYGRNPYEGLSGRFAPLISFERNIDGRHFAMERVVGVSIGSENKAYPFSVLVESPVVNDRVGGRDIVVLWGSPDTADALNRAEVADGRAIGSALVLDPVVDGRTLSFHPDGERFVDVETGSVWTILGQAVEGPLQGTQLDTITHRNDFWFAWTQFYPDTLVESS